MPRLPEFGQRLTPQANVQGGQVNPNAAGAVGAAVAGLGNEIGRQVQAVESDIATFQTGAARSSLLKASLAAEREVQEDRDGYGNWQKSYDSRMQEALNEASGMIADPRAREAFVSSSQDTLTRGSFRMQDRARTREHDHGRGTLANLVRENIDAAVGLEDQTEREAILEATGEAIAGAVERGYIDPEDAAKMRTDIGQDYARRRLDMLEPEERFAALGGSTHRTQIDFAMGPARPEKPNKPILDVIGTAAEDVFGQGARVVVTSGQEGHREQHGSNRHKTGDAADIAIYRPDGSKVKSTDPDMKAFAESAARNGALGIGFGAEYMGGEHIHVDLVTPGEGQAHVWGSGGKEHGDHLVGLMNGAEPRTAAVAPEGSAEMVRALPADEVVRMRRQAERQVQANLDRQEREYVSDFGGVMATVQAGVPLGADVAATISDEAIAANVSDPQARELMTEQRDLIQMQSDVLRQAIGATPEEQAAMVSELAEQAQIGEAAEDGVDVQMAPARVKAYQAAVTAIQADRKRRVEDPVGYVMSLPDSPVSGEMIETNPAGYAAAMIAEQTRLGVPANRQRVLTSDMATNMVEGVDETSPDAVAASLRSIREEWGEYGPRLQGELLAAGMAPEYVTAMRHWDNPALAARIVGLKGVSEPDLMASLEKGTPAPMLDELSASAVDYREAFEAGGGPAAMKTFNANFGVARRLTLQYMREGRTDAAEQAYADIFPEIPVNNDHARLLLPANANEALIGGHLEGLLNRKRLEDLGALALDDPAYPDFADDIVSRASLADTGIWLNNSTGDGVVLAFNINGFYLPVKTKGGADLEIKFADIGPVAGGPSTAEYNYAIQNNTHPNQLGR